MCAFLCVCVFLCVCDLCTRCVYVYVCWPQALAASLAAVESRMSAREKELLESEARLKGMRETDMAAMRARYEALLAEKDAQIDAMRAEVRGLWLVSA